MLDEFLTWLLSLNTSTQTRRQKNKVKLFEKIL